MNEVTKALDWALNVFPVTVSVDDSYWFVNKNKVKCYEFIYDKAGAGTNKLEIYVSTSDGSIGVYVDSTLSKPYPYLIHVINGATSTYFIDSQEINAIDYDDHYNNLQCIIIHLYVGNHPLVDFMLSPSAEKAISTQTSFPYDPVEDDPLVAQEKAIQDLLYKLGSPIFEPVLSDNTAHSHFKMPTNPTPEYYPTSDPIVNYKNLQESENSMEITLENVSAGNRTLVIVYGSKDSPSDYKERAARLIGSLNLPDTIKAVVITINGNKIYSGLDFNHSPNPGKPDADMLDYVGKRFVQVLEVRHSGAS